MDSTADRSTEGSVLPALGVHPCVFLPSTAPPFSLYVRTTDDGRFRLFHKAGRPVYANAWNQLDQGGFDMLYVHGEDRDRCFDYVEENLSSVIAEGRVPDPNAARWTYRLACRSMENVLSQPGTAAAYRRLEGVLAPTVQALRQRPGIEWDMLDSAPLHYRTPCHCVNVCVLLTAFALHVLEVRDDAALAQIALGGALHDLGKIMVPESILNKPDELTRGEFAKITQHPRFGAELARPFLPDSSLAEIIIFQHHEDTCGGGYPEGRSGDDIHLFARVARVVDVFDAITTHRPYGTALDEYRALNTMVSEMRRQFDMDVLRRFIRYVGGQSADAVPIAMPVDRPTAEQPPDSVVLVAEAEDDGDEEEPRVELPAPDELQRADGDGEALLELRPMHGAEPPGEVEQPPGPAPLPDAAPGTTPLHERARYGRSVTMPPAALEGVLEEWLRAIRGLQSARPDDPAVISGLVNSLKKALETAQRRAARAETASARSAREIEEKLVRGLFPLIWQVDEWEGRFTPMPHQEPETAAACADARSCLRALRENLMRVLLEHNVEPVHDVDSLSPEERLNLAEPPPSENGDASGRVRRVGFIYHDPVEEDGDTSPPNSRRAG